LLVSKQLIQGHEDKMMKANILLVLGCLCTAGLANAECPSNLANDELVKCQGIEDSGINYQEWLKNQREMADESTISPVTGQDVRSVSPAAGAEEDKPESAE
jgi:hypothetical protein